MVMYLGCELEEKLPGEAMASKVINNGRLQLLMFEIIKYS